ncbi:MAG: hypothetical protein EOO68_36920, partial [Moraxellaceae bacterium]
TYSGNAHYGKPTKPSFTGPSVAYDGNPTVFYNGAKSSGGLDPVMYHWYVNGKWVSDSIKTSSISVENNGSGFELAKTEMDSLSKIDLTKSEPPKAYTDDNFVVLAAKCMNTKRPYLIKYQRNIGEDNFGGLNFHTKSYRLNGAYQVDNSYFELADESSSHMVHSDELIGAPSCPCCANTYGLALCACQKVHCLGDDLKSVCPWCGNKGTYGVGDGGFDITRAQG